MAPVAAFFAGAFGWGTAAAWGAGAAAAAFGAGAALGGTILGKLAVKLLTSVAISALQMVLTDTQRDGGVMITATLRGEDNPETILLGRYATSGQCVYVNSHGKSNRFLTHVVELCSAPGATLNRLMLGDKWVTPDWANPDATYGAPIHGESTYIRYYDGRQTAADPHLVATYGADPDMPWAATAIGTGLCYAILTFYYDDEERPSVPAYRFEMDGIPLYDVRKDSTAGGEGGQRLNNPATWSQTNNPIVMAWNILRGIPLPGGEIYGGGYDLSLLPAPVWMSAMNRCDVAVEIPSGTEPAYRAGIEASLTQEPAQPLTEIFKACSATIADMGYAWTISVGAPGLPVYSFTDDDVIVSNTQTLDPFPSLSETYNAVSARYPSPAHLYESREAPLRTNAAAEASDAFGRRTASLTLPAAPYGRQVQRLTAAWLKDERRFIRHIHHLPPDSSAVELTDTVDWTSARNGYNAKVFSVGEITEDVLTGIRQFSFRERDPSDYDWSSSDLLPEPPTPTVTPRTPEPVDGFDAVGVAIVDANGQARRAGIQITWNPDVVADALRWRIRFVGQTTVQLRGDTRRLDDGFTIVSEGVLPARSYEVSVRLIKGRKTEWSAWKSLTTPDVRLGRDDVQVGAITEDVTNALAELDDWSNVALAESASRYRALLGELVALRDNVAELRAQDWTQSAEARQRLAVSTSQSIASVEQSLTVAVTDLAALSQYAVSLAAQVAGKAEATAVSALTTRVDTAEGQIAAQSTAITDLTAAVGTKASAAAVTALAARVTDTEAVNSAQATAITNLNVALDSKAAASAVTALDARVTDVEGVNTSQATQITNLNTSLAGKASASALTALEARVTDAEGVNTSQATLLTTLNTSVGNVSASGLFAVQAEATPSGALSRIGLKAKATAGETASSRTAALFLEAVSGGTSRIVLNADSVAVLNGSTRVAPFVVTGGQVYLGDVKIRSGEVTGDMIVGGATSRSAFQLVNPNTAISVTSTSGVTIGAGMPCEFLFPDGGGLPLPAGSVGNRPVAVSVGITCEAAAQAQLQLWVQGFISGVGWQDIQAYRWYHNIWSGQTGVQHSAAYNMVSGGNGATLDFYSQMRVRAAVSNTSPFTGAAVTLRQLSISMSQLTNV